MRRTGAVCLTTQSTQTREAQKGGPAPQRTHTYRQHCSLTMDLNALLRFIVSLPSMDTLNTGSTA